MRGRFMGHTRREHRRREHKRREHRRMGHRRREHRRREHIILCFLHSIQRYKVQINKGKAR